MSDAPGTPNADMTKAWDGVEGDNWTENEAFFSAGPRYITPHLFAGAAIAPGERVLDIGCGFGDTTRLAARAAVRGEALGVDLSTRMLERARERARAEGLANARFERGDAQVHPFEPGTFDIAISRLGVMFFDDPVAAFTNIARALKSGGRIAMLAWREIDRNEWVSALRETLAAGRDLPLPPPNAPGPFAFADPDRVRSILGSAGFTDVALDPVEESLYMGPDAATTFDSVKRVGVVIGLLESLDEAQRTEPLKLLRAMIEAHETTDGVLMGSSAWLIRATKAP